MMNKKAEYGGNATVQIYVGEKEKQSMKKSAKIIHEKLQDSFIQVLPNMYQYFLEVWRSPRGK